jgi:GAF domain-containing protein
MIQARSGEEAVDPRMSTAHVDVREQTLWSVLGEFARTVRTNFPVQGILGHLVKRIVDMLPIPSAGIALISAGVAPHYVAVSDHEDLRFEHPRSNPGEGEGPCVQAFETGQPVVVPDLRVGRRFPRFAPAAATTQLTAVFTFSLNGGVGRLGALDLYRDAPAEDLDSTDMVSAQTLTDVAAAYLLNAQARDELV